MKQDVRLSIVIKKKDGRLTVGPLDPLNLPKNAVKCDDGSFSFEPVALNKDGSMDVNVAYPATLIVNPFAYMSPDQRWDEMVAAKAPETKLTKLWNLAVLSGAKVSIDQAIVRNDSTDQEIDETAKQAINALRLSAEVKKTSVVLDSSDVL